MKDNEILHKEIDILQSVINRISTHSFILKGWFISITAVVVSLNSESLKLGNIKMLIILILADFMFWYLDGFLLQREKRFRKLYEWVIKNRHLTNEFLYDLDHTRFSKYVSSILRIMFSNTLFIFYGIPMIFFLTTLTYLFFF